MAGSEVGATNIDKEIMKLLLDNLPPEGSVPCDVNSPRHKAECESYDDYKYTKRCVTRYHEDYDRRWTRNPKLRGTVISIKERFGR